MIYETLTSELEEGASTEGEGNDDDEKKEGEGEESSEETPEL